MARQQPALVVISEDPRVSHRANEAMRIALGIVAGDNEVHVVLTGPAVHLLDEDTDDLVDGDDIAKFRAALKKLGVPVPRRGRAAHRARLERRRPSGGAVSRGPDRRARAPRHAVHRLLMAAFLHLLKADSAAALAASVIEPNLAEPDAASRWCCSTARSPRRCRPA